MTHQSVLALAFFFLTVFPTAVSAQETGGAPEQSAEDPAAPDDFAAQPPEPSVGNEGDKTEALEVVGVTALSVWTVGAFVGSPVALVALSDGQVGPGEAMLLTATNLLGVGTLGLGFAVMGAGAAMVIIGSLGYLFTFGYWDEAAAMAAGGLAMMGVGALLSFVAAPLVFTLNTWLVDGGYGDEPDNVFASSAALIGGTLMGAIGGYYLTDLLIDFEDHPVLGVFAIIGTSLLVGNVSYALTRRATDDGPAAVIFLPPITF